MSDLRDPSRPSPHAGERPAQPAETGGDLLSSLLESPAFAAHTPSPAPAGASLTGVCVDDRHPTLIGRVRVRWKTLEGAADAWLPTLQGLVVRGGDQVLLSQPLNGPEPIVIGVVDGFAHRPPPPRRAAASLELKDDEALVIEDARGRPLIEVRATEGGPAVRLLQDHLAIEVEGKLAFRAAAIRMEARQGAIEIEAADDVCVKGEVIHLN